MSKNDLFTLDTNELTQIHGGVEACVGLNVGARVRGVQGSAGLNGCVRTSNYESCLANNQRQASEVFPDSRGLWGRITGQEDTNARPRAELESSRQVPNCGLPPLS